jgi:hypothetical protein
MWTKLLGLAAVASAIALSGTTPALAVCNPGTPNCIRADSPWLAKAKQQVHQGDGNFNCDPGPDGFCSKSIPSGPRPASSAPATSKAGGTVTVAPPIQ